MPLTRAQAEDFVSAFFADHRLPAPPLGTRCRFAVTRAKRKRLNLPRVITREALADQVAARLCREVGRRDKLHAWETEFAKRPMTLKRAHKPKWFKTSFDDFVAWRNYVRLVVVRHFGKGDGLK